MQDEQPESSAEDNPLAQLDGVALPDRLGSRPKSPRT